MKTTNRWITAVGLMTLAIAWGAQAAEPAKTASNYQDWPNWRGPLCSGWAPSEEPLIDDMARARFLWKSEEDIPSNAWSGGRHGSYDSPVIADGKVFIGYQSGKGTNFKEADKMAREGGEAAREWVVCDYVILAIDAQTGKTVWRTVVDQGPNMSNRRKRPGGHHAPCYWKGRVYAQSTLGRIYCLDAKTGKVQWQVDGHKTEWQIKVRDAYAKTGKMHPYRGYNPEALVALGFKKSGDVPFTHGYPVIVVDGVVIAAAAPRIDAETGKVLGDAIGKTSDGDHCEPLRWAVDGKEYVIKGGTCYEPRSGKERWAIKVSSGRSPTIGEGYVVYASGWLNKGSSMSCYAITPDGVEKRWTIPGRACQSPGVIHDGWFYGKINTEADPAKDEIIAVELATGKIGSSVPIGNGKSGMPSQAACDGRFIAYVTHGDNFGLHLVDMNPKNLKTMGYLSRATLGIAHGSSPAVAGGRLYYRGRDNIYCFDLRAANALKPGESNRAVAGGSDSEEEEE